jgi:hypothetical protein
MEGGKENETEKQTHTRLVQNNAHTFQTRDLKTLPGICGSFRLASLAESSVASGLICDDDGVVFSGVRVNQFRVHGRIGGSFWLSSLATLLHLQGWKCLNCMDMVVGKNILELGAGTALPSLFLSKLCGQGLKITASDRELAVTKANLFCNGITTIATKAISWEALDEVISSARNSTSFPFNFQLHK